MVNKKSFIFVAILAAMALVIGLVGWFVPRQVVEDLQVDMQGITNFDTITLGDDLTVTGTSTFDDIAQTVNAYENLGGLPTVITVDIAYGTLTGTVATIADGEVWIIHDVFVQTATSFACTGDDCTLDIGDGNDVDGFVDAADANIQSTFTEATGYPAGWYGLENGSNGAYTVDEGIFVYAPSGAAETIDYAIGGTTPAAGAATIYVVYTRVE